MNTDEIEATRHANKFEEELLPCPFCGGDPSVRRPMNGLHNWEVRCLCCGAATTVTHEDEPRLCIGLWNARSLDKTLRDLLAECDLELSAYAANRLLYKDTAQALALRCRKIYESI